MEGWSKEQAFKARCQFLKIDPPTVDYALPQLWVDHWAARIGPVSGLTAYERICSQFVWVYDEQSRILGRPFPLTKDAEELLIHHQDMKKGLL